MLVVNNQNILRHEFAFKGNERRSVSANFQLPPGSMTVRIYVLSEQTQGANTTTSLQLTGGETRTIQLEFSGGKLLIRS